MAKGTAETTIARSPDEVWDVVGDFGGLAGWMPGIESCQLDGDVRKLAMMGMEISERLESRDDATRSISYSICGGPAPIDKHLATITVHDAGGTSRVTWDVDVEPDEMLDMFVGVYGQSLDALAAHCQG